MRLISLLILLTLSLPGCDDNSDPDPTQNNTDSTNTTNNNTTNANNTNNNTTNANNTVTTPANMNKTPQEAMRKLFPGLTHTSSEVDGFTVWTATQNDGTPEGYGIISSHSGFNSYVRTMTLLSTEGETLSLETLDQNESWWYRIDLDFFEQFQGILFSNVTVDPDYNENCTPNCETLYSNIGDVDGVSGATWSSDAIIKNATDAYLLFDQL